MRLKFSAQLAMMSITLILASASLNAAEGPSPIEPTSSHTEKTATSPETVNDPLEGFNRAMFAFNRVLDGLITKPVAEIYRGVLPQGVQNRVHSFLNNLGSPLVLIHDLLQLKLDQAGETLARFVINTTLGVGGLFDVADEFFEIKYHSESMGTTLAYWGVGGEPFIVLPLLGPTNPRDFVGKVADAFADPFNVWATHENKKDLLYGRAVLDLIDRRAKLSAVFKRIEDAYDPYAMMRTLYLQNRLYNETDGAQDTDSPSPNGK